MLNSYVKQLNLNVRKINICIPKTEEFELLLNEEPVFNDLLGYWSNYLVPSDNFSEQN